MTAKTTLAVTEIATGLNKPWGVALLDKSRFLVSEKAASRLTIVAANGSKAPVSGTPATDTRNQGGMLGVANPGAVSSSKDKTFPEVATDARKRMDEKYALMKASDKPYTGSDEDRNGLMGDLDRRSLNAVATNEGGLFTAEEQASAQALMRQQGRLATGYYSGPADQQKNWKDPFANDPYGRAKAALDFMNNMSPEEKAKPEWLSQRLSLEAALNQSQGSELDPAKKKTGHFPNLAEILSGAVTQSDEDKDSQSRFGDPSAQIMKTLEARNA